MRAGQLDRPIVIQRNTPTLDSNGAPVDSWAKIHSGTTIAAGIIPQRGAERFTAQQVVGRGVTTFRIRWRDGITTKDRIVYDGRNWDIHDVREVGRREGLDIDASARSDE